MGRVLTWRWILIHLGALALVVAFLLLGWWQIGRARGGNMLSYGYAVEWPAFAAFVVWVWAKEVRAHLRGGAPQRAEPAERPVIRASARQMQRRAAAYDDSDDAELAAYNDYLAWLNAHPEASPSEYPGRR